MSNNLSQLELEEAQARELIEIESSKAFRRLKDKTQVLVPSHEYDESVMNRQSHSFAVASSANQMIVSMAKDLGLSSKHKIDHSYSLRQSCLLHDIGHPPFGHDGAKEISMKAQAMGLKEGFDDNSNNLQVIESNNINLRGCVLAAIIKYPEKLYAYQGAYLDVLKEQLELDKKHFMDLGINLKNHTRTINCQIMDEADRNTYTCDDMRDYFLLNEGKKYNVIDILKLKSITNDKEQLELINELMSVVNPKIVKGVEVPPSKTEISNFFNKAKRMFNDNWKITENGLDYKNKGIHQFRELLSDMTMEFYIKPIRTAPEHKENMLKFNVFINKVFDGEYGESKYYRKKMDGAKSKEDFIRACRDAVAEVSDHFIKNSFNEILGNKRDVSVKKGGYKI